MGRLNGAKYCFSLMTFWSYHCYFSFLSLDMVVTLLASAQNLSKPAVMDKLQNMSDIGFMSI
jgi:hypothetical protein